MGLVSRLLARLVPLRPHAPQGLVPLLVGARRRHRPLDLLSSWQRPRKINRPELDGDWVATNKARRPERASQRESGQIEPPSSL